MERNSRASNTLSTNPRQINDVQLLDVVDLSQVEAPGIESIALSCLVDTDCASERTRIRRKYPHRYPLLAPLALLGR
jgi:hypothetical protein